MLLIAGVGDEVLRILLCNYVRQWTEEEKACGRTDGWMDLESFLKYHR
jgi:hypothetical protein